MGNLPNGLTPEKLERWMADNPGATQADGVREYLLHTSQREGKPLGQTIRDAYTAVAQPVTNAVASGVDKVFGALAPGGGEDPNNPGSRGMAADMIAKHVVPQTPESAVLMATAPLVSRIGASPTSLLANRPVAAFGARMGAQTAVGAGTAAATGGSAATGALEGATSQAFGEGMRGAQALTEMAHNVLLRRKALGQATSTAEAVAQGIAQDVPAFSSYMTGKTPEQGLFDLTAIAGGKHGKKTVGEVLLGNSMQKADDAMVAAMGGPKAQVPSHAIGARQGLPQSKLAPTVSIEDALALLKEAKAEARKAPPGPQGYAVRQNAKLMEEEIANAVAQRDPGVAAQWKASMEGYGKGLRVLSALEDSKAFEGPLKRGTGPTFNPDLFTEYMTANRSEVGANLLPKTWEGFLRGAQPGARSVTANVGGERLYAGRGMSGKLPQVRYQLEPIGAEGRTPLGLKVNRPLTLPTLGSMVGASTAGGSYTVE